MYIAQECCGCVGDCVGEACKAAGDSLSEFCGALGKEESCFPERTELSKKTEMDKELEKRLKESCEHDWAGGRVFFQLLLNCSTSSCLLAMLAHANQSLAITIIVTSLADFLLNATCVTIIPMKLFALTALALNVATSMFFILDFNSNVEDILQKASAAYTGPYLLLNMYFNHINFQLESGGLKKSCFNQSKSQESYFRFTASFLLDAAVLGLAIALLADTGKANKDIAIALITISMPAVIVNCCYKTSCLRGANMLTSLLTNTTGAALILADHEKEITTNFQIAGVVFSAINLCYGCHRNSENAKEEDEKARPVYFPHPQYRPLNP